VKRLVVASTNPGKVREIQAALSDLSGWSIEALLPGLPPIQETGATFVENASQKAAHYSGLVDGLVLADDSGLCVHALNNAPGIHSARYAPTAAERNKRVLAELALANASNRDATFVCAFALARRGEIVWTTEARLSGCIAAQASGSFGFDYDPIFYLPELGKTLAELTPEEKNRTSHRGRAIVELRRFLAAEPVNCGRGL
jgi:non-canonical purine NTP pyrophosphatase (RdgB/HAM1 family)